MYGSNYSVSLGIQSFLQSQETGVKRLLDIHHLRHDNCFDAFL
jgi:hypothetical protein